MIKIDNADVQGFVVSGYAKMHHAVYVMARIVDAAAARAWVGSLASRATSGAQPEEQRCLNVAFTASGLAEMGVDKADLHTFATPFQEGMAHENRARTLGDTGPSDPQHWDWGGPATDPVHMLLLVFAADEATRDQVEAEEIAALTQHGAFEVVQRLTPEPLPGRVNVGKFGVEHFGFADGMSQPVIEGSGQEAGLNEEDARRNVVPAGEFLLGYPNGYGKLTPVPKLSSDDRIGINGTYLVFRQLEQDVAGFWQFLDGASKDANGNSDAEARTRLAAKLVGRWPSGAPLVQSPHSDDPALGASNSFDYAALDADGFRCPIGSHVRRTNPRDTVGKDPSKGNELANLHRILRRGRVYGPGLDDPLQGDDGNKRGLLFMCLNANIERQFEFIQHTWANNTKFGGLYDEQDPLLGNPAPGEGSFTIQEEPVRQKVRGVSSFVTTRGGAYFFLPGINALRSLAAIQPRELVSTH